jgi:GntR family transcriptional regulator
LRDVPFVRFLQEQGLEPVTQMLEKPERRPMPADLAREFGVPEGTLYVARMRRDGTKKRPYRLTSKYYLASLIDDETLAGMQANDKYDAILDIKDKHGIIATFMTEDIIARLPTQGEQELLEIVRIAPVMEVKRTCYDQEGGRILWLNRIVLVASLFVFHQEYTGEALWHSIDTTN